MLTLQDSIVIFRTELGASLRNRIGIAIGLVQPFVYLALFGPLLVKALPGAAGNEAWKIYIPGLLVQCGLFATGYAGFNLIPDMRSGVLERMRVTPVSRLALLLGRVMRDCVLLLIQATILIIAGFAFGLRASAVGIVVGLLLVVVLGISLAALSYTLAMKLPTEYLFAPVLNSIALPLMLLSGILLPLSFAPTWLRYVADVNPFHYVVDAMRALYLGQFGTRAALVGVAVAVGLAVVSTLFGTRTFTRYNA
ncbi:MAG TPA: ABC transporter permease [Streptosporangiaceae bacterium]|nr:ABC transporter permease [Streptosporangiaceae bacterium]